MMGYLENIPKVKEYCLDNGLNLQEWLTEKHRDDVVVNPKEEALFV